jgi:hypothetical protein
MKKFSFLSSVFLLIVVVVFLFVGCQKETAATEEENTTIVSSDGAVVKGIEGTSIVTGLISPDHAQKMSHAFAKKYPDVITNSVGYSTKNLIAYLTILSQKYKIDSVFVGFGLYDNETAPKRSYIGRATIFFMGDNSTKLTSGAVGTDEADQSRSSNYLNGGTMLPPPASE